MAFDTKIANERNLKIEERNRSFGQLRQRYKNNLQVKRNVLQILYNLGSLTNILPSTQDMRAAHAREFVDISARVAKVPYRPRSSYVHKSSSFRGTHSTFRSLYIRVQ